MISEMAPEGFPTNTHRIYNKKCNNSPTCAFSEEISGNPGNSATMLLNGVLGTSDSLLYKLLQRHHPIQCIEYEVSSLKLHTLSVLLSYLTWSLDKV